MWLKCKSGKIAYTTQQEAQTALEECVESNNHGRTYRGEKKFYKCSYCEMYHLTHKPKWKDRLLQRRNSSSR